MKTTLYVPKQIKVGYNSRSDTYGDKLGFATYVDDKEKIRHENVEGDRMVNRH